MPFGCLLFWSFQKFINSLLLSPNFLNEKSYLGQILWYLFANKSLQHPLSSWIAWPHCWLGGRERWPINRSPNYNTILQEDCYARDKRNGMKSPVSRFLWPAIRTKAFKRDVGSPPLTEVIYLYLGHGPEGPLREVGLITSQGPTTCQEKYSL